MNNRLLHTLTLILTLNILNAQFQGNNLLEYQHGELPGDTATLSSLYDRASLSYKFNSVKLSANVEQFHTPYTDRNYVKLSGYTLNYKTKPIELNVGHFYETLGRGLLLRSFEIQGALLEDISYRSKQYFHRDIFGANIQYRNNNFTAKAIYGKPLNNLYPPIFGDTIRRTDIIEAAYLEYTIMRQTIGGAALRLTNRNGAATYGMFTLSGRLFPWMSYYTEYAQNVNDPAFALSKKSSSTLYSGFNIFANNWGLSLEYKNYNNFILGAGINEPPALVKEHTYKVLNRSTHVVQPISEQGIQAELYYSFANGSVLTLNNTIAINTLAKELLYREYFAEYSFTLNGKHDTKLFFDYAEDPFKLEVGRTSAGAYTDWQILSGSVVSANYEFQTFRRTGVSVFNHVFIAGYNYKSKFNISVVTESSTDGYIMKNNETQRFWFGANAGYKINSNNTVTVFGGQRRGGPACQAGVCYEVLDFAGVELRITSRF